MDISITATFDDDTKRMHRFIIDDGQSVTGTIYVPKDSTTMPETVIVRLRTKAARDKDEG